MFFSLTKYITLSMIIAMKYNGIEFDAIVATPGCGKSYLCDKYPELFVDVDEERLRCKYYVPDNITRDELEATKGNRPFKRRADYDDYVVALYEKLDKFVEKGKTLIAAPHREAISYLVNRNIKFCFVYPDDDLKEEIKRRMEVRGNSMEVIQENYDDFERYLVSNKNENKSVVHYHFSKDEYLEDILLKFGFKFD